MTQPATAEFDRVTLSPLERFCSPNETQDQRPPPGAGVAANWRNELQKSYTSERAAVRWIAWLDPIRNVLSGRITGDYRSLQPNTHRGLENIFV
jgi:hypothetical protein